MPVPRRGVTVAELNIVDFREQLVTIERAETFLIRLAAGQITIPGRPNGSSHGSV